MVLDIKLGCLFFRFYLEILRMSEIDSSHTMFELSFRIPWPGRPWGKYIYAFVYRKSPDKKKYALTIFNTSIKRFV